MLKINKNLCLNKCSFNLNIMFRIKNLEKELFLKKKLSQVITLRSPKHFNIGKNKVLTVNSKVFKLISVFKKKIHVDSLINSQYLWKFLVKTVKKNIYSSPKSITIIFNAKFKI